MLGSDGLLDNCYPEEIAGLAPGSAAGVDAAAAALAALAASHASDPEFDSPYSREAREEGVKLPWWEALAKMKVEGGTLRLGELHGGKLDDITVVVAYVEEADA